MPRAAHPRPDGSPPCSDASWLLPISPQRCRQDQAHRHVPRQQQAVTSLSNGRACSRWVGASSDSLGNLVPSLADMSRLQYRVLSPRHRDVLQSCRTTRVPHDPSNGVLRSLVDLSVVRSALLSMLRAYLALTAGRCRSAKRLPFIWVLTSIAAVVTWTSYACCPLGESRPSAEHRARRHSGRS